MKKITFTLLMFLGIAMVASAQSNLIFFTENGEQFYVILNGIRQNDKPQTNVMVRGLTASGYKAKIIFADKALGELDKNLPMNPAEPIEATFVIKKGKDGQFVMRFMGQVPVAEAPAPPAERQVVVYNTTPMPPVENVVVTQTTTTTTTTDPDNVNININVPGINVTVNDPYGTGTTQTTTKTTKTTTTTSTSIPVTEHHEHYPEPPVHHVYEMPGYHGPIGCDWPISEADFRDAKTSISSKSFDDTKLTMAKQIFDSNCMTSSQVKEIMKLFSFEENKLVFAKYAYGHTFDIGNFYKVNDVFTFSSSVDELNSYIEQHKK